ncbi:unnamed protein product [Arctia plantaginis]|uniref:Uncharacterized protein n=1 Tax=Arctia plantaginis TaxID=874455 RepID=A0A8S0ZGD9_ARCPL|nr:unnamed protein product [Arctia plantaginis]
MGQGHNQMLLIELTETLPEETLHYYEISTMTSSRGRKILALVTPSNDNNKTPDVLMDEIANNEGSHTLNCEFKIDNNQPTATPRLRSSSSSTSSSLSSRNSSSSSSYKEDSDDSVKDPLYQPENLMQPASPLISSIDDLMEANANGLTHSGVHEKMTQTEELSYAGPSNIPEADIKSGRKRMRNESCWKKNIVKRLKNTGKSYKSTATKKVEPERKMQKPCNEKCRLRCSTTFTEMDRKMLFDEYWQIGDVEKHWNYLSNCMTAIKPKYRYVREGGTRNKREYNNALFFTLGGEKVRVCKLFFKNTLGITDRPIRTVMFKRNKLAGTILAGDTRGKHSNHPKIDESIRSAIKTHIESITKIDSHYTRANTSKEFIDGSRTIAEVHKDYVDISKRQNVPYGNYMLFYKIFTEDYNISFFKPKKDRCDTCAIYENCENEYKENRKEYYESHLIEKDICREEKAKDKENDNVITAVYDLQAIKKQVRGGPMYTPEAFISAVKTARSNPEPFKVNMMSYQDFLDWKDVCSQMGFDITKDENGDPVKFIGIKVVKLERDHPRDIFLKHPTKKMILRELK